MGGFRQPFFFREGLQTGAAEYRAFFPDMVLQVLRASFDDLERVDVALICGIAPGEETMRAEHDPADSRVLIETLTQL